MYGFCIGEVGISPSEYWKLTETETIAKIAGYVISNSNRSTNFRNIYGLNLRLGSKEKRPIEKLWPIPTDFIGQISTGERYEQNKKILNNG